VVLRKTLLVSINDRLAAVPELPNPEVWHSGHDRHSPIGMPFGGRIA